ncbi:uncharacterized protein B0J16DRAFT_343111 [Fusarium flagelliforme]|uniref:uncharacterized protein n=1 Tax=Fusarium flagelliforme TaxID=2675880 RepID=UPI001E8EF2AA|nr:uncharacterized protein B0J16DRAFT_343111 [Fusarium flagelliforme]KAH7186018.1 hypothetical protein B0J16DRAFT_343111 [Fusarium flagelliforme]
MPDAQGIVIQNNPTAVTLVFEVDGQQFTLKGQVNPPIQPFSVSTATLQYNGLDDLTSNQTFRGQIGPQTLNLVFQNGTAVIGQLNPPGVEPASMASGVGIWEQN